MRLITAITATGQGCGFTLEGDRHQREGLPSVQMVGETEMAKQ